MAEENGVHESGREENKCLTLLPLSRIKNIMKQCPDINAISSESLFIITRYFEALSLSFSILTLIDRSNRYGGGDRSTYLVTFFRATELFIELMTREAFDVMDENYKVI